MGKIAIQQNRAQTHDGHDKKRKRKALQQRKARASQSLEFSTRIAAGTAHLDVQERPRSPQGRTSSGTSKELGGLVGE